MYRTFSLLQEFRIDVDAILAIASHQLKLEDENTQELRDSFLSLLPPITTNG